MRRILFALAALAMPTTCSAGLFFGPNYRTVHHHYYGNAQALTAPGVTYSAPAQVVKVHVYHPGSRHRTVVKVKHR